MDVRSVKTSLPKLSPADTAFQTTVRLGATICLMVAVSNSDTNLFGSVPTKNTNQGGAAPAASELIRRRHLCGLNCPYR